MCHASCFMFHVPCSMFHVPCSSVACASLLHIASAYRLCVSLICITTEWWTVFCMLHVACCILVATPTLTLTLTSSQSTSPIPIRILISRTLLVSLASSFISLHYLVLFHVVEYEFRTPTCHSNAMRSTSNMALALHAIATSDHQFQKRHH